MFIYTESHQISHSLCRWISTALCIQLLFLLSWIAECCQQTSSHRAAFSPDCTWVCQTAEAQIPTGFSWWPLPAVKTGHLLPCLLSYVSIWEPVLLYPELLALFRSLWAGTFLNSFLEIQARYINPFFYPRFAASFRNLQEIYEMSPFSAEVLCLWCITCFWLCAFQKEQDPCCIQVFPSEVTMTN